MLQSIRESAQGVVAWVIVILISVPFALWGIQEYLGVGGDPVMVSVNGQDITERDFDRGYREFRQSLRERLGSNYRPELIDETLLRKEVLDAMIRNRLIMQEAESLNLHASDEMVRSAIRAIPSFQAGGQFNQAAYDRGVRIQGLTPAGFEEQIRGGLISDQLPKAISGSEIVTTAEIKELVRLSQQMRDVDYLLVPSANFTDNVEVSEADARAFFDANQQLFMAPERAKVLYLELDVDNIAKTQEADEEVLKGYYDQHKSEYIAEEQRSARHILISVDDGSDGSAETDARNRADGVLGRIRSGEDFATLARELSEDPGSAEMGGDLGYFAKGEMDEAFEKAVLAMNEGDVSEPVRSEYGFHIIELTGVRPEQGKSFEEAREDVKTAYLKAQGERLFYEYAERMNDLAYEDPDSLDPAAEALGIEVKESDWFTRDGGEGVATSLKVVSAAFSDDVLVEGHNSEAIELGAEHMVVLRILEHEESALKEYSDVSAEITTRLKSDGAAKQAQALADELIGKLKTGADLSGVARENGLALEQKGEVDRNNRELPPGFAAALFVQPKPAEGEVTYGSAKLSGGDVAVIALKGVREGTTADLDKIGGEAAARTALQRSYGRNTFEKLVENLRSAAAIEKAADQQQE